MKTYYSNGKLLLTGEYVVLDGALSLALPSKFGQALTIDSIETPHIVWESIDETGCIWFHDVFSIKDIISGFTSSRSDVSNRLVQILCSAKQLNPDFLNSNKGFKITTSLNFPKDWGLGTSSTLINNIAHWAHVDAYQLLHMTFGGSGYDIACAQHNSAITYQLIRNPSEIKNKANSVIQKVNFNPVFKEHIYFVYLNKKQNSREGIAQYKANKINSTTAISEISDLTSKILESPTLQDFEKWLVQHEHIISKMIKQKPVNEVLFNDFKGSIKSLGAWGGDFILATSNDNPKTYFNSKGFETVVPYKDMILEF